jgi:putative ABC transport system permease protein
VSHQRPRGATGDPQPPRPPRPPRIAALLLRLLLPGPVGDAFAGDLEERYRRRHVSHPIRARLEYWSDVLSPSVLSLRAEARGLAHPPGTPPARLSGDGFMHALWSDVRFAFRSLLKSPAFSAVAILSLALGIGPNTAIFSLVNSLLFQDWGVDDPERIVDVYTLTSDGRYFFNRYGNYELIAEGGTDVFEAVTAHSIFAGRFEGDQGVSETVLGEMVTGDYFDVMGVEAARGRTFLPEEDATPGTHPVLVVSDDMWRTRYGADPGLVGSEVRLNGRPYTVVGVAPPRFRGRIAPGIGTGFWVPISMYPHLAPGKMGSGDLTISARLRPGRSAGEGLAAIETIEARINEERQATNPDRRTSLDLIGVSLANVRLHPGADRIALAMAALLFGAVGLVLLVACVNLAGFLLSRAVDRRKEMAIRVAMGAGRGAIVRQLLVESLMLATIGGVLGLVLGQLAARAMAGVEIPLPLPIDLSVELDGSVLLFTGATTLVAALLFGLTPALEATRAPVAATLRGDASGGRSRRGMGGRAVLVTAQMALATVLLFGGTLFVRSLDSATRVDLGFSARDGAVARFETDPEEYDDARTASLARDLVTRLEARPEISRAAVTGRMPLALGTINFSFSIPGVEPPPDENLWALEYAPVSAGYFETLEIEILEGRAFLPGEAEEGADVVVLSRAAADRFWPGESAVGRIVYGGGDPERPVTVVGVVDDVKIWSLSEAPRPYAYLPYRGSAWANGFYVVARGPVPDTELVRASRQETADLGSGVFLSELGTVRDHLGYVLFLPRMAAGLLSLIGVLALVLACMGLYGMVSYGVARRTREVGIRLALGAERGRVVSLILRGGLLFVAVGGVIGVAASLGLGGLVEGFLFGVNGMDPLALLAAPLLLALVASVAAYLPARRASRVDPVRALRAE